MPNYCDNILTVEGTTEDIAAFTACVKDDESVLSFERTFPTPPCMLDKKVAEAIGRGAIGDTDYRGMPDWYWWRVEHWGTKWDALDPRIVSREETSDGIETVTYYLNTAWSPPEGWMKTTASLFATLRFTLRYVEEGMDFAGWLVCRADAYEEGEVTIPRFTPEEYEEGAAFFAEDIDIPTGALT